MLCPAHILLSFVQALGRACFDLNPEQRPTFKQAVQQLEGMLAQSQAANPEPGSEAPTQIREPTSIPDVVTCTTQSVQHTEMDLTSAVQQTAAAASG